ncbi:MAG: type II toxin-antitoxin system RatA family toxin [Rickettsiales bacterium]|nr:type II toxin-antitoxin system RatA family toxin [Rickettsiales bacterium]
MPAHQETSSFPFQTQQLYELVEDVEKYPEFLPWCRAARILERTDNVFTAELVISFKGFSENYTSQVICHAPRGPHEPCRIDVGLVRGPFHHLTNHWIFEPDGEGSTIHFSVDFAFKSKILDKLIGSLFTKATHKMVEAFSQRAYDLYGSSES